MTQNRHAHPVGVNTNGEAHLCPGISSDTKGTPVSIGRIIQKIP